MRRLDVIALDEALEEDLPVDVEVALVGREQPLVGTDQLVEPAERIVARRRLVLRHEHQAQPLDRRHRHQRMGLLVEARETRPRAECGAACLRDCRSSRGSGRRRHARSPCRRRPACRGAGRRCGRPAPCRRCRAPRRSECRQLLARRMSRSRARPSTDRTASVCNAARSRSRPSAAPATGSWRPARAKPAGRGPSCRWRCGRGPAARPTGRPLPSSCPRAYA